jgi:muconate cycloisomerase
VPDLNDPTGGEQTRAWASELKAELEEALVGRDPLERQRLVEGIEGRADLRAGVEVALYDILGQAAGLPLLELLGGRYWGHVHATWIVYLRPGAGRAQLPQLREEVRERAEQGFRCFKIKVGVDLELDELRLAAIREEAGSAARLFVDANAAWTVEEAPRWIDRLARFDLLGVESPIEYSDIEGKLALKRAIDVPIIEHALSPEFVLKVAETGAADALKVSVVSGGIDRARQVLAIAQAGGLDVYMGGTVELSIISAASTHVAAASKAVTIPSGINGPLLYLDDVVENPLQYEGGKVLLPEGPGLGMRLSREALERLHIL